MFKCKFCHKSRNEKPIMVVLETRQHVHKEIRKDEYGNVIVINAGEGTQIVREEARCSSCVSK